MSGGDAAPDADSLDLEVESVAVGGDGVAREPGGRVVFVPRTAPGDRVRVRLTEEHGSWARGRVVELLSAGPGRTEPPCPYYGSCGGCQLQHLERAAELAAKGRAVADALERIGGRRVEVPVPEDPGPPMGYRNRVTFTLRRSGPAPVAGYHRLAEPDRLLDVERCPLAEEPVARAWTALRGSWGDGAGALPGGEELRVTVRASEAGRAVVLVEGGEGEPGDPDRVEEAVPNLACYAWRPRGADRRLLAGTPVFEERWLGVELRLGPETFLQVNRRVAEAMERHLDRLARERLGGLDGRRAVDLYAGAGVRAIRWAEDGARAAACEADGEAVRAGREAARRRGADVDFHAAAVEERAASLLPSDLVVVNPPRAGLSRDAAETLRDAEAGALAYVSCDPATLGRDLERLGDRWRIADLRCFDAFPQTAHVETVAWLEPG